jgi:hypothetical protein
MFSGVNLFAIYTGLGAAIGTWQVVRRIPEADLKRRFGFVLAVLLGVLLGARAGYVLFHTDYYGDHRGEIFQFWLGGLDWIGALAGGLFVLIILWRVSREPLDSLADSLAPLALPLAAGAWLGCMDSGCAYGPSLNSWLGFEVPDEFGILTRRFPLQLMAVLLLVIFTVGLDPRPPRIALPGQYASLVGLGLSGTLLLTAFLRAAPAPRWAGMRPDVWAALFFALLFLAAAWKWKLFSGSAVSDLQSDSEPGVNSPQ